MSTTVYGYSDPQCTRDEEGYREYTITYYVISDDIANDGPATALLTPGLPLPGSFWVFKGEFDTGAWCKLDAKVTAVVKNEPNYHWSVELKFATRGTDGRCKDEPVDDPLMEPDRISGSSTKFTEEAAFDRFGRRIVNSAFEQMRGPQNEWDNNRHTVKIEQNVADLQNTLCSSMVDCVNDTPLWGLAPRKVKLSSYTWSKKYYGQCFFYYVRSFEFEINFRGWDRNLLDEGTKVLNGKWNAVTGEWDRLPVSSEPLNPDSEGVSTSGPLNPDPNKPTHFIRFVDKNGNTARVILDGHGLPYDPPTVEDEEPTWWVILLAAQNEGFIIWAEGFSFVFEGTCSKAVDQAVARGADSIMGPFVIEGEAQACADNPEGGLCPDEQLPTDVECETISTPGSIHIEKYPQANFLFLNIPTEF